MSVWANSGNFTRAVSEFGLVNVEQQRMLRNNNLITNTFMSEKNARAQEADDQRLKAADLSFKKLSAEKSRKAADLVFIGAALNLLGTALKEGVSLQSAPKLVNGFGEVVSKFLDILKADAEEEAVEEDLKRLNAARIGTDDAVAALDSNPYG